MRTTNIRFTGLASGLDTESLVNSMITPYKMKVDTAKQNQTMMEWKKEAWRDMNKKLFNFYDQHLNKLRLESTYNKRNISVSNSNAIEIRPNSTLPEGTHKIDSIKQLAESAKVNTGKLVVGGTGKVTTNTKLGDLLEGRKPILDKDESIRIKVSDSVDEQGNPIYKDVELSADMTIGELQNKLKTALPNTNVNFDESAGAFFITGEKTGESQFLSFVGTDDESTEKAFKLMGINKDEGFVQGTETVLGQITFEADIKAPATTKLSDLGINIAKGDKLALDIDGSKIEIDLDEDMTISEVEQAVNGQIDDAAEFTFKYDTVTGKFIALNKDASPISNLSMKVVGQDGIEKGEFQPADGFSTKQTQVATQLTTLGQLGITGSEFAVTIDGVEFSITLDENWTLEEFAKNVQDKIGDKAVFSFDKKSGKLVTSSNIEFDKANKDLETLGIQLDQQVFKVEGKNAIVSYNGIEVQSESNNISVNGFNFTVKSELKPDEGPITVVSTFDSDAVVEVVKGFVDEYNKLIEDIHTQIGAPSAKGYKPLTDEQKKEMSDYEIEQWEKKIKDSLFRNDPDLEKVVSDMRQVLGGTVVGNAFGSLSAIGISTGNWKENGKLHFDEEKFRKALTDDTDGVIQLLGGNGDPQSLYLEKNPGKTVGDYNQLDAKDKAIWENQTKGFMDRMYDHITQVTKSSELRTTYSFYNDKLLTKNITNQKDEVSKLQDRMYKMEDMYYKRFTAMEKMMSQLNNQSNYLMSQLGGM